MYISEGKSFESYREWNLMVYILGFVFVFAQVLFLKLWSIYREILYKNQVRYCSNYV